MLSINHIKRINVWPYEANLKSKASVFNGGFLLRFEMDIKKQ